VDGGLAAFRATRRRPLLLVGDLDSVDVPTTGLAVKRYPVAKDYSDFAGALEEAKRLRARVVVVAGSITSGPTCSKRRPQRSTSPASSR
jgi:thiamine pyrophosphokinase